VYTVQLKKPGYITETFRTTLIAGIDKTVHVSMLPEPNNVTAQKKETRQNED
jgi:hypothetical protein